jgi:hypothetical protein
MKGELGKVSVFRFSARGGSAFGGQVSGGTGKGRKHRTFNIERLNGKEESRNVIGEV